ncbi:MAG: tRNA lysidine(34) synthetase TilS [Clostridia bacterium]|nr:tRNA lysidine(34) synthetase TilS [Clostridia bacterium]
MSEKEKKTASSYLCAEKAFLATVEEKNMLPLMQGGVLLALSGGADSVLLLALLSSFCEQKGIALEAMHVNHGIRGKEAQRDSVFCTTLCKDFGIPLHIADISIPALASKEKKGLEETARKHRYLALEQKRKERSLSVIATAHNADDFAETVLLHLIRGTGLRGLCGIAYVRDSIIRPLLNLSKDEVYRALEEKQIPYVEDSTNKDIAYSRNYIRQELLPRMKTLNPSLLSSFGRMGEDVGEDAAYLDALAKDAYDTLYNGEGLDRDGLCALPYSLAYRAVLMLHEAKFPSSEKPTRLHIRSALEKLQKGELFSLSFPSSLVFYAEKKTVFFQEKEKEAFDFGRVNIHLGENSLENGGILYLLEEKDEKLSSKIHKTLIHKTLCSANIYGGLYVRSKQEGDSYRYGKQTKKLKKLFSQAQIPPHLRSQIPVLCDEKGIIWVAGFGVREDVSSRREDQAPLYHLYYIED